MADDVPVLGARRAAEAVALPLDSVVPTSAIDGPRRRRRWLQYSMRTMLVMMAVVAALMSFVGVPLFRFRQQLAASERLQNAGARLTSDAAEGLSARLAAKVLGDKAAVHVTQVFWENAEPGPDDLADLQWLEYVEKIDLCWSSITDDGVLPMRHLQRLKFLGLDGATVTDRGLSYLSGCRSLQRLKLHDARVTDAGLVHLAGLSSLENLDLSRTQITGDQLEPLVRLPALEVLNLNETPLGDGAVVVLSQLKSLRWLGVSHTHLTEAARDALAQALPKTAIDD